MDAAFSTAQTGQSTTQLLRKPLSYINILNKSTDKWRLYTQLQYFAHQKEEPRSTQ